MVRLALLVIGTAMVFYALAGESTTLAGCVGSVLIVAGYAIEVRRASRRR